MFRLAPLPMPLPIQLISTDFDGTLFAEFENPPVPDRLQEWIARLQSAGAKWVINTGRDLSSLLESIARAKLWVKPDFIVVVEREIYQHTHHQYAGVTAWNKGCTEAHATLFRELRPHLPEMMQWIEDNFNATVYEDSYSPFCLIAENNADADHIQARLEECCAKVDGLTVVRNDVYARFSHVDYNKGTALAEVGRLLGIGPEATLAAGDHLNDLPMLRRQFARYLVAPSNAIPVVREQVLRQSGYLSSSPYGHGVASGLEFWLEQTGGLRLVG